MAPRVEPFRRKILDKAYSFFYFLNKYFSSWTSIMRRTFLSFRGEEFEVEFTYENDPSVGIDGVCDWGFVGEAPEPTPTEFNTICDQLTAMVRNEDVGDDFNHYSVS